MEAYIGGVSTRRVDALVAALGSQSGISKSQVSRICRDIDQQVQAFLARPLESTGYAYVYFPKAAALMHEAREDVLAFRPFPNEHWRKIWSTNLLERVNEEI